MSWRSRSTKNQRTWEKSINWKTLFKSSWLWRTNLEIQFLSKIRSLSRVGTTSKSLPTSHNSMTPILYESWRLRTKEGEFRTCLAPKRSWMKPLGIKLTSTTSSSSLYSTRRTTFRIRSITADSTRPITSRRCSVMLHRKRVRWLKKSWACK